MGVDINVLCGEIQLWSNLTHSAVVRSYISYHGSCARKTGVKIGENKRKEEPKRENRRICK